MTGATHGSVRGREERGERERERERENAREGGRQEKEGASTNIARAVARLTRIDSERQSVVWARMFPLCVADLPRASCACQ